MHTRLTSQTVPAAFFPQGGARVRRRQVLLTQPLRLIRILLCASNKWQVLGTRIARTVVCYQANAGRLRARQETWHRAIRPPAKGPTRARKGGPGSSLTA